MFRAILTGLVMAVLASAAHAQKIGIGAWENPRYTMLEWIEGGSRLNWYYNWRTDQIHHKGGQPRTVEFVPMIHGARNVGERIRSDLRVTTLLGFNEPDGRGTGQTAIPVEQAIDLWPRLEAYGLRLGSPATTRSGTLGPGSWQRRFMDMAEARGLRVDFMAVHYYSTNGDVEEFRRWLHRVHAEYGRPIWVTEFGMIDWSRPRAVTYAQNAAFIQAAILMMEDLPFVERHAWFAANPYPWNGVTPRLNLVDNELRPTEIGLAFDSVARRLARISVADAGDAIAGN